MRSDVKSELQMLRELAWLILPHLKCWFCKEPISAQGVGQNAKFGHRRHTRVAVNLTWHHLNEDRENNRFCIESLHYHYNVVNTNLVPCHPLCHRKYHNQKRRENAKQESTNQKGKEVQIREDVLTSTLE